MSASTTQNIRPVPAPWTLKGTIYYFMIPITEKDAVTLSSEKDFLYSPLEANSSFANHELVGGSATVQVVRYSESPVGPYDELVILPGNFKYPKPPPSSASTAKKGKAAAQTNTSLRVTRIYVSQENSCWNGRKNWNIPKHLARFHFEELPKGGISISVYPLEKDSAGIECIPSKTPFFSATFKTIPYVPSFPASRNMGIFFGLDLSLVQPPLPEGKGAALPGTKLWSKVLPSESSSKTSMGRWDLKVKDRDEREPGDTNTKQRKKGPRNWWPGIGRWKMGFKMENATIKFPAGEHWTAPS